MFKFQQPLLIVHLVLLLSLTAGCTTLPPASERLVSYSMPESQDSFLLKSTDESATIPEGQSSVVLLDDGKTAFLRRLQLLESAQHSIDVQYYIWHEDKTGKILADSLLKAADRGVRVRVLLDDFGADATDLQLRLFDAHPNIEVRLYNPIRYGMRFGLRKVIGLLFEFTRINRRMHNKMLVVDSTVAIIGGRNIGDEYFDSHPTHNFRDRDVMVSGSVIPEITEGFDDHWNSLGAVPVSYLDSTKLTPESLTPLRDGLRHFASNQDNHPYDLSPYLDQGHIAISNALDRGIITQAKFYKDAPYREGDGDSHDALHEGIAGLVLNKAMAAKQELLLEAAYVILDEAGSEMLTVPLERNVEIKIVTNSLAATDTWMSYAAYSRNREQMLDKKIQVFEIRPDAASCRNFSGNLEVCDTNRQFGLHSKTLVIDRSSVFIGSYNFNPRSKSLNSETGLLIHSRELAERVAKDIEINMKPENSWLVQLDDNGEVYWQTGESLTDRAYSEPMTSFWLRFKSRFLSLFPLEKYF